MELKISRVKRSKADARASYNRLSSWYDRVAGKSEEKYRQIGVRSLNLQPGERVLEIGFGTGHCLLGFAQTVGPSGWVCGLDLSDGMAAITRERLGMGGVLERVGLALADGTRTPFQPKFFDAVFMSFTLELFDSPEIPMVLDECKRVMRDTGRLTVVAMAKTRPPGMAEKMYEWFHARMPVLVDCRPIEVEAELEGAGFGIVNLIRDSMWGLPVEIITARR
jgi:ubiquinone/menaquinone biosynthesis C-methylase UbiE